MAGLRPAIHAFVGRNTGGDAELLLRRPGAIKLGELREAPHNGAMLSSNCSSYHEITPINGRHIKWLMKNQTILTWGSNPDGTLSRGRAAILINDLQLTRNSGNRSENKTPDAQSSGVSTRVGTPMLEVPLVNNPQLAGGFGR